MAKSKTVKKMEEFKTHLKSAGWKEDRWGHFTKEMKGRTYRFKINSISARFEVKVLGKDHNRWANAGRGEILYYKNFHLVDNKISFKEI